MNQADSIEMKISELPVKTWAEAFADNYAGRSPEAHELEQFLNSNYQGNSYIPWATMERLLYQQDPNAEFIVNESDNGFIHQQSYTILTRQDGKEVLSTIVVNMVMVSVKFLGKRVTEHYPIQSQDYGAPKVVDQNMVNKAIKRAFAKAASRVSGLALKLYEKVELQFEATVTPEPTKPVVKKSTSEKTKDALKSLGKDEMGEPAKAKPELPKEVKKEEPQVEAVEETEDVEAMGEPVEDVESNTSEVEAEADAASDVEDPITKLVNLITGKMDSERAKRISMILKNFNPSLRKTYNFEISTEDDPKVLAKNLKRVVDPSKLLKALERVLS